MSLDEDAFKPQLFSPIVTICDTEKRARVYNEMAQIGRNRFQSQNLTVRAAARVKTKGLKPDQTVLGPDCIAGFHAGVRSESVRESFQRLIRSGWTRCRPSRSHRTMIGKVIKKRLN